MELESWEQPARGLREYFRQVAWACGSGEAFSVLEPATNQDLITLSYLDGSVCPPPEEVAMFAADPAAGSAAPTARAEADVLELLSEYAVVRL
jgi:hypothetical protein